MMEKRLKTSLGKLIRKKREALGISQEALAFDCNLNRTYIGEIELAKRPQLSIGILCRIAKGLGTKASALLKECGE